MQRLPSLNALRAFEAAARLRSLTRAARELNVTPAAVSHQVKALEADLGIRLINRVGNDYRLTSAAEAGLPLLRGAFDQLSEAVRRMRLDETRHFLTLSVGPTFASTWLVRRVGRFSKAFPEIDLRLQTSDEMADFYRDGVDVAIRFGSGDYPGLEGIRLFKEEVYPVCSPRLLEGDNPLREPADLARFTLLHIAWHPTTIEWETWLRAAGVADVVDWKRGPSFSHANTALQAAIEGEGVTLGSDSVASDDLAAGRLVRPFALSLPLNFAYHLVYPKISAETPKVAAFRQWILSETAGQKALQEEAAPPPDEVEAS